MTLALAMVMVLVLAAVVVVVVMMMMMMMMMFVCSSLRNHTYVLHYDDTTMTTMRMATAVLLQNSTFLYVLLGHLCADDWKAQQKSLDDDVTTISSDGQPGKSCG